jgi:flagellar hook-length control protein FliK
MDVAVTDGTGLSGGIERIDEPERIDAPEQIDGTERISGTEQVDGAGLTAATGILDAPDPPGPAAGEPVAEDGASADVASVVGRALPIATAPSSPAGSAAPGALADAAPPDASGGEPGAGAGVRSAVSPTRSGHSTASEGPAASADAAASADTGASADAHPPHPIAIPVAATAPTGWSGPAVTTDAGIPTLPGTTAAAPSAAVDSADQGAAASRRIRLTGADPIPETGPALPAATAPAEARQVMASAVAAPVPPRAALLPQISAPVLALARSADGDHSITVTVSPDSLGPVTVRAHIAAGAIRLELHAPSDAGREALRAILTDLRRDLAAAAPGSQLVLSQDGSSGATADGRHGGGGRADTGTDARPGADARPDAGPGASAPDVRGRRASPLPTVPPSSPRGGIDLYA